MTGEPRRNEFRPGDPEKLMVVTGWRVAHADSAAESRVDRGSHTLVLVCEPGPARLSAGPRRQLPAPVGCDRPAAAADHRLADRRAPRP